MLCPSVNLQPETKYSEILSNKKTISSKVKLNKVKTFNKPDGEKEKKIHKHQDALFDTSNAQSYTGS